jgi:hypothetical protein
VRHLSLILAFLLTTAVVAASARTAPFQPVPPLVASAPASPASPSAFTPAPMPDLDFDAPSGPRKTGPPKPELAPGLLHAPSMVYKGEGYTPHSMMTDEQDRRFRPSPGVNLRLPLE